MEKRIILLGMLTFLFSGCAFNDFAKHYDGLTLEQIQMSGSKATCESPQVSTYPMDKSLEAIKKDMLAKGYVLVGTSQWEGPATKGFLGSSHQGKKIGACLVLWNSEYLYTLHGEKPVTVSAPDQVSTVTYDRTIRLPGGKFKTVQGTAEKVSPGITMTEYVPYAIAQYKYVSAFFVKSTGNPL